MYRFPLPLPANNFNRNKKADFRYSCFKLSGMVSCKFCEGKCQKAGRPKNGQQKLYCKACKKYQQARYKYMAYKPEIVALIPS